MDYGERVAVVRHSGWTSFLESRRKTAGRLVLFTTEGETALTDVVFRTGDCLLFGRESAGAPDEVRHAADVRVRIPLAEGARSLNVAMAAGVAVWEALRQTAALPRS